MQKTAQIDNVRPSGTRLQEIIARYEKLLGGCTGRKSERCADVIYTLGNLYYDESVMHTSRKEKIMKSRWKRTRRQGVVLNRLTRFRIIQSLWECTSESGVSRLS